MTCTEFTQKIHHADDDDDARHQAARRDDRVQTVRDVAAARRAANADDDSICCPGINGSFFRMPSLSRCICRHGILRAVNACCWHTRQ